MGCAPELIKRCSSVQELQQLLHSQPALAPTLATPPPPSEPAALSAAGVWTSTNQLLRAVCAVEGVVVMVRGLHYKATEQELRDFFRDYEVCHQAPACHRAPQSLTSHGWQLVHRSIQIEVHDDGRAAGAARVSFVSKAEAERAVREKHGLQLGPRCVQLGLQHQYCAPQDAPHLPPLLARRWRAHAEGAQHPFTVVSWNLLAAGLGDDQFRSRAEHVCWAFRSTLLLQVAVSCCCAVMHGGAAL